MVYYGVDAETGARKNFAGTIECFVGGQPGAFRPGRREARPQEWRAWHLRAADGPVRGAQGRQGRGDAARHQGDGAGEGDEDPARGGDQPVEDARRPHARPAGPVDQGIGLRRGRLIVVSGPSGAGKSTLIRAALDAVPGLAYSVSATTRKPREGEVDGCDYIFLSREEFEKWISEGRFLEWAEYSGNLYGTLEQKVEEFLNEGRSIILELELQGARQVHMQRPDAVMVFVRAPSLEETRRRLTGRATETEEALKSRLATAVSEVAATGEFDYEVVNDDRERARNDIIEKMESIVRGGRSA